MRALRVHTFEQGVCMEEVALPEPGRGEVRVRVLLCGVSFVDLLLARGAYQVRPPLPYTGGSEFAGVVDALGEGVDSRLSIGDQVSGAGAGGVWAQYLCAPAAALHRVDAGVSIEEAAVLNVPFGTSLYALRERGHLRGGETLLVLGASGGVGHAAVQWGNLLGARVIATASSEAKRAAALEAGAHEVVDTGDPAWKERVKALSHPRGVDVVFDPVGGEATDAAFRTLGWGGRHLMIGFASGEIPALRGSLAIVKGASLVGVDFRQFGEREPMRACELISEAIALHRQGRLRPRIAATFEMARFHEAADRALNRGTLGRVLVRP